MSAIAKGTKRTAAQPCVILTNATPNADTQCAAHSCRRALVKAHTANAGLVWVNFGAAATDGGCVDLLPDGSISVPATNTNQIHALFKTGGDKLTVVYEF